jgi:hypothetical protein
LRKTYYANSMYRYWENRPVNQLNGNPKQFQNIKMKKLKTVILYGQAGLHVIGVEAYLNNQVGWEVVRITKQADGATCSDGLSSDRYLLHIVQKKKPAAVILYKVDGENYRDLPGQLLRVQPNLRIITLNLDNNIAEVYGGQEVDLRQAMDLLLLIDCP